MSAQPTPTFIPLPSNPAEPMTPEQLAAFSDVIDANCGDAFRQMLFTLGALELEAQQERLD